MKKLNTQKTALLLFHHDVFLVSIKHDSKAGVLSCGKKIWISRSRARCIIGAILEAVASNGRHGNYRYRKCDENDESCNICV